jgi:hypothetical protein
MAQTHFFMTRNDSLNFVSFLVDLVSAEFVPQQSGDPPPFPRYATMAQVQAQMERDIHYSRFFVLSRQWELLPLVFDEIHANDGRHFFVASQRYGGPAFDFIPSSEYSEGDVRWIVSGSFSDYSYYIEDKSFIGNHSRYRTFDRPEAMTTTHKEVQKYLRRNGRRSICLETGHTGPWIASGALKEFDNSTWLRIGDWHFEPKGR